MTDTFDVEFLPVQAMKNDAFAGKLRQQPAHTPARPQIDPLCTSQVNPFMNNPDSTLSSLDVEVLRQFRVIFKSVRKHFSLIESMAGVSGAQLWALHAISSRPGLRVTELSKAMSIHQSTASNLVEKLVEHGYAERKKSPEDSRVVRLSVTALGQDRLNRAPGPVRGILPEALEQLPQETLLELHRTLGLLLEKMAVSEEQDGGTPLSEM